MIWAILAFLGVPLWLCAAGVLTLLLRNRALRRRSGNVPVRVRSTPGGRWTRGHAVWVGPVFVFRASPAAWKEHLLWVDRLSIRDAGKHAPHRLGKASVIAELRGHGEAETLEVAARAEHRPLLAGSFVLTAEWTSSSAEARRQ